jgi:hypothetical protein
MSFAPNTTPRGHSYFEGFPPKQNELPTNDDINAILKEANVDLILQGSYARHVTTVVQKGVGTFYKTPTGKIFNNGIASTSL